MLFVFRSSRFYAGYKGNPLTQVRYTSEIFAGKDGPMFRVTAADDADNPKIATTATSAWKQVHFWSNCRRSNKA